MRKILCIGEALIDMICTDKGTALKDGDHFLKKAGGAPTNVAAAIAALGGKVALAAKLGKDPFGDHLIAVMQSFGIDTTYLVQDAALFTTFAFVSLQEDGERDFVFNRGADAALSIQDIEQINLADTGIVHFGSATAFLPGPLQHAYIALLQKAKAAGLVISFDPNYRHLLFKDDKPAFIEQSWTFLAAADIFKVSEEEALLITGTNILEDAVNVLQQKTSGIFAITLGKAGTLLRVGETTLVVPSIAVQPVDTTGAGDAFIGALLYQLQQYNVEQVAAVSLADWQQLVANANKAGARTTEYMGAMEAFRHLSADIFKV